MKNRRGPEGRKIPIRVTEREGERERDKESCNYQFSTKRNRVSAKGKKANIAWKIDWYLVSILVV
jgi:hypothetical protein